MVEGPSDKQPTATTFILPNTVKSLTTREEALGEVTVFLDILATGLFGNDKLIPPIPVYIKDEATFQKPEIQRYLFGELTVKVNVLKDKFSQSTEVKSLISSIEDLIKIKDLSKFKDQIGICFNKLDHTFARGPSSDYDKTGQLQQWLTILKNLNNPGPASSPQNPPSASPPAVPVNPSAPPSTDPPVIPSTPPSTEPPTGSSPQAAQPPSSPPSSPPTESTQPTTVPAESSTPLNPASFAFYLNKTNIVIHTLINATKNPTAKIQKDLQEYRSALTNESSTLAKKFLYTYPDLSVATRAEVFEKIKEDLANYSKSLSALTDKITFFKDTIKNTTKTDFTTQELARNGINLSQSTQDPNSYDLNSLDNLLNNAASLQKLLQLDPTNPDENFNSDQFFDAFNKFTQSTDKIFVPAFEAGTIQDPEMENTLANLNAEKEALTPIVTNIHENLQKLVANPDLWGQKEDILRTLVQEGSSSQSAPSIRGNGTFRQALDAYESKLNTTHSVEPNIFFQNVRNLVKNLFDRVDNYNDQTDKEKDYSNLLEAIDALPTTPLAYQRGIRLQNSLSKIMLDMKNNLSTIKEGLDRYAELTNKALNATNENQKKGYQALAKLAKGGLIANIFVYNDLTTKLKDSIFDFKDQIINREEDNIEPLLRELHVKIKKSNSSIGYNLSPLDSIIIKGNNFQDALNTIKDFLMKENPDSTELQEFINKDNLDKKSKSYDDNLNQIDSDLKQIFTPIS